MSAEAKLAELKLTLPTVPTPIANYVPFKRVGDVIYLSGQARGSRMAAIISAKSGATSPSSKPTSTRKSSGSVSSLRRRWPPAASTSSRS